MSYMQDQALMQNFAQMLQMQSNPAMMQMNPDLMKDQRLLELFMAYMGMDMPEGGPGGAEEPFRPDPAEERKKAEAKRKAAEEAKKPKDERTDEQKAADVFKEEANAL